MGENAEIFERLRSVEMELATLNERLKWHEKLFVVAFGGLLLLFYFFTVFQH